MPQDTPAQKALEFAVTGSKKYKGRKGRHCANLLSKLSADLKHRGLSLPTTVKKLLELRTLAGCREQWKKLKKD